MAYKVFGAGNNSTAQNVFKVTFSEATSNAPTLEAWSDDSWSTTINQPFTGTTGNGNKPMISAIATTNTAPASNWVPSDATPGGAIANRLKGDASYVELHTGPVSASGSVRFNLCWTIPSDAWTGWPAVPPGDPSYNIKNMFNVFALRFSYAGSAPLLTWQANSATAGGNEGTPFWATISPGMTGNAINAANAGSTPSNITMHRPVSGIADIGEVWVV